MSDAQKTEVYVPGKCWHGVIAGHKNGKEPIENRVCGKPAKLYQVSRESGIATSEMWLCEDHRFRLAEQRYIVREKTSQ